MAILAALVLAAPVGAQQVGGQRLHVTAVPTGTQPAGSVVQVDLDCAPALLFPPSTMYFYGPGDQDVNAQGMAECTLVAVAPKDSLSMTVRCTATGEATCVSDRTVRGTGQFAVTFTVVTAFPAVPPPPTTSSLPAAVPTTVPGPGGPPSTTSGAPLPTNPADPANPTDPRDPGSPGDPANPTATNGDGGSTGAGSETAAGGGTTTMAGQGGANVASGGSTGGSSPGSSGSGAAAGDLAAPATDAGGSSLRYLVILLAVLAVVAAGAFAGTALRRRLTPADARPTGDAEVPGDGDALR